MTTQDLALRAATPGDAPALAALRWRFRVELAPPAESEGDFRARCATWMATRLAPGGAWHCWVATSAREAPREEVVAMLWAQRIEKMPNPVAEPELHVYVTSFFVVPEARGGGLGGRMLARLLDWARDERADAVLLWPSARSRSLYLRHGFAVRDDLLELRLGGST